MFVLIFIYFEMKSDNYITIKKNVHGIINGQVLLIIQSIIET